MMDMAMAMDMQLLLNMDTKKIIILVIMDTSMKSNRNTIMGSLLFQGMNNQYLIQLKMFIVLKIFNTYKKICHEWICFPFSGYVPAHGKAVLDHGIGYAVGHDAIGHFDHHTGPFGPFGFYANYYHD